MLKSENPGRKTCFILSEIPSNANKENGSNNKDWSSSDYDGIHRVRINKSNTSA